MKTAGVVALAVGFVFASVVQAQSTMEAPRPLMPAPPPQYPACPPCAGCCDLPCEDEPYPLHVFGGVEFLYWAVKETRLSYPLLTTSTDPAGTGIITDPSTRVLFHQGDLDHDALTAGRSACGPGSSAAL